MSSPCPCPGLLAFNGFIVDWISRLGLCTADHTAAASAGGHLPTHLGGNLPVFINMTSPGAGPLVTWSPGSASHLSLAPHLAAVCCKYRNMLHLYRYLQHCSTAA